MRQIVARFDRYLLSQLMMLFSFFALVLVSVYWVNRAVNLFDQLISDGQSAWVFLEFTALTLPNVIRLVLPVAAFVAAVYVTNRLSAESELIVMQAAGFSPFRLARPVLYFGLIVGLMVAVLVHALVPASRTRLAERSTEISQNNAEKLLVEGVFNHPSDGLTFYVRNIAENGELEDLFLADARDPARRTIYTAQRAIAVKGETGRRLVMFDGINQELTYSTRALAVTRFQTYSQDLNAILESEAKSRRIDVDELSTADLLWPDQETSAAVRMMPRQMVFAAHERFAQPLLAIAAALLGFSALLTGGFSRFGLWRQIVLGSVLLILVQLLVNAASRAGLQGGAPLFVIYLPGLAGILLSGAMLAYAGRKRPLPRLREAAAP